jgi:pyruvate/2-oxoglutarate dehydrogenase complex dihydrolipoamide acyltransferase (E2) component
MGLIYDLPLPNDTRLNGPCRIVKWHVKEWSKLNRGSIIATVQYGKTQYHVLANGPGFIYSLVVAKGAIAMPKDCIAKIASEGEDVPYGKPYSLLEETKSNRKSFDRCSTVSRLIRLIRH